VRYPFLELPGAVPPAVTRPVLPVQLEDLEIAPLVCLLDTGASANRFGVEMAELAGISLVAPLDRTEFAVAGIVTAATCVRANLTVADHRYEAPVWFCNPWPFGFGLLGLDGFFRFFRVTISAAEEWLECEPESAA
jgi:hypothetical protein